jgi:hypothetical protein
MHDLVVHDVSPSAVGTTVMTLSHATVTIHGRKRERNPAVTAAGELSYP